MVYIYTLESEIAKTTYRTAGLLHVYIVRQPKSVTINMNLFYLPVVALFFKKKDP